MKNFLLSLIGESELKFQISHHFSFFLAIPIFLNYIVDSVTSLITCVCMCVYIYTVLTYFILTFSHIWLAQNPRYRLAEWWSCHVQLPCCFYTNLSQSYNFWTGLPIFVHSTVLPVFKFSYQMSPPYNLGHFFRKPLLIWYLSTIYTDIFFNLCSSTSRKKWYISLWVQTAVKYF